MSRTGWLHRGEAPPDTDDQSYSSSHGSNQAGPSDPPMPQAYFEMRMEKDLPIFSRLPKVKNLTLFLFDTDLPTFVNENRQNMERAKGPLNAQIRNMKSHLGQPWPSEYQSEEDSGRSQAYKTKSMALLATQNNADVVLPMALEIIKAQRLVEEHGEGKWLQHAGYYFDLNWGNLESIMPCEK
ncbi:hypothetical protein FVEG_09263 [Fusarium verticillioides 7600]|uniref:Uncharacterized protein n=1 Tax=Gibberella moniliformis (strain M3125 / FGSC 7600) TaxID=334819 RepID=W7MQK4_GIBM7|nr:hypothetical protein FVEG_09263 [Fusarium verticillioides 7600]EWG49900.1 hypothetical protein FVEG_09263 [Fusarium verticillioides 7600]